MYEVRLTESERFIVGTAVRRELRFRLARCHSDTDKVNADIDALWSIRNKLENLTPVVERSNSPQYDRYGGELLSDRTIALFTEHLHNVIARLDTDPSSIGPSMIEALLTVCELNSQPLEKQA